MLDLNEVAIFAKVVEASSFTGGSRLLGLPKATVSRKISELEARLGVRLLERTTRKLRLTEDGRSFYLRCNQHIAAIEEANQAIAERQTEPQGTLRLSLPRAGYRVIVEFLTEFMTRYPKLKVEVILTEEVLDLIEHDIDVAIRAGILNDSSLIARKLGPAQPLICASPSYLQQHGIPQVPDDLRRHDCIVVNTTADSAAWRFQGPNGPVSIPVTGRLECNDVSFALHMAIGGLGIVRLPLFTANKHIKNKRLQTLLNDWNPTYGSVYAVYPSKRNLPTKVRAFLDFLDEKMKPHPPWLIDMHTL